MNIFDNFISFFFFFSNRLPQGDSFDMGLVRSLNFLKKKTNSCVVNVISIEVVFFRFWVTICDLNQINLTNIPFMH